jgi:hypothetical protein
MLPVTLLTSLPHDCIVNKPAGMLHSEHPSLPQQQSTVVTSKITNSQHHA